MRAILFFCCLFFINLSCSSTTYISSGKRDVSPYEFGLAEAKSGIERYQVLLKTHQNAVSAGVNVDYSGIDSLYIEIPKGFKEIPLTQYNDFKGCVLSVKNSTKNCCLFSTSREETSINLSKRLVDGGVFKSVPELSKGKYILLIEDEKPWVLNRKGHSYGHQRRDVLYVEDGKARNRVIMPYDNEYSSPKCSFIPALETPLVVKNLTVLRDPGCTYKSYVLFISGFDNVQISNLSIYTPQSSLTGDRAIRVYNSTNVSFDHVHIEGTYSQPDVFGYGISLGSVWNFKARHLYGNGNWGVFGSNDVNTVMIEDSQINRFDIHCYGRDVSFNRVHFFDLYNGYSGVYGTISHKECTFTDFIPVLNGGSYNAFVGHDIVFTDCVFYVTANKNYLFRPMGIGRDVNERHELAEKAAPNIMINNMTVYMSDGASELVFFWTKKNAELPVLDGINQISVDGLTINAAPGTPVTSIQLSNRPIETVNEVSCTMKNVVINQPESGPATKSPSKEVVLKTNLPVKDGAVRLTNVKNLKLESK